MSRRAPSRANTPQRTHAHRPALVALLFAIAGALLACGPARDPLAGHYVVKGGGAPLDVFNALTKEFTTRHPGVLFQFEDVGSRPGMALVASGDVDLGTSSADPDPSLRERVRLLSVGVSGTAVVVNSTNGVSGLSRDQVRAVFSGEITDWAAVGGQPGTIFVAMRNPGSAIRSNFEAYFFGSAKPTYAKDMFELNDIDQTIVAVSSGRGVISIITINDRSLGESRIRLLDIDGARPTKDNLASGVYPVRRPLYLVYHPTQVKPAIQAFLDFVRSPDGQRIIAASAGN